MSPQPLASCLFSLEKFMLQSHPICGSIMIPEKSNDNLNKAATAAEMVARILGIKDIGKYTGLSYQLDCT